MLQTLSFFKIQALLPFFTICLPQYNWGNMKGSTKSSSHRCIEGQIYWWKFASGTIIYRQRKVNHPGPFIRFGGFLNVCGTEYIGARWLVAPMYWWIIEWNVISTLPICLNIAYPSAAESRIKMCSFKMATKLKGKRISSTKVREHYLTFVNYPTPSQQIFLYQRKVVDLMDDFECELFQIW